MSIPAFNFFNDMPLEIFGQFSSYLSTKDLRKLCQTHRNIRLITVAIVLKRLIQEFLVSQETLNQKIVDEKKVLRSFAENKQIVDELFEELQKSYKKIDEVNLQFKICNPNASLSPEAILKVRELENLSEETLEALRDLENFKRRNFKEYPQELENLENYEALVDIHHLKTLNLKVYQKDSE